MIPLNALFKKLIIYTTKTMFLVFTVSITLFFYLINTETSLKTTSFILQDRQFSANGYSLHFGKVENSLPDHLRIESLEIHQNNKRIASLHSINIKFKISDLLATDKKISHIHIEDLFLESSPLSNKEKASPITLPLVTLSEVKIKNTNILNQVRVSNLAGSVSSPAKGNMRVKIQGEKLEAPHFSCDHFQAHSVLAAKGAQFSSLFAGIFSKQNESLKIKSHIKKQDDTWIIRNFHTTLGDTSIKGDVTWSPQTQEGDGLIEMTSTSFEQMGGVMGVPLRGSGKGFLKFSAHAKKQSIDFDITASHLDLKEKFLVKKMVAKGSIENPLKHPKGRFNVQLNGANYNAIELDKFQLAFDGQDDHHTIQISAKGDELELTGKARTILKDNQFETYLENLHGTLKKSAFSMTTPKSTPLLRRNGSDFWMNPVKIQIGKDKAEMHLSCQNHILKGELRAEGLRPDILAISRDETINAHLKIGGTDNQPTLRGDVSLSYSYFLGENSVEPYRRDISGQMDYADNLLKLDFKSASPTGVFDGSVALPLDWNFQKKSLSLNPKKKINGFIRVDTNFDSLAPLFIPTDAILSGDFKGTLNLTGTLESPSLKGALRMVNGRFEDDLLGTHIRDINGTLQGNGKELRFINFNGFDPYGGRIGITGALSLKNNKPYADLTLGIQNFKLAENASAQGIVDGAVSARGFLNEINLDGTLSVPYFNVNFGDFLKKTIPTLNLENIRHRKKIKTKPKQEKQNKIFFNVVLAIKDKFYAQGFDMDTQWGGVLNLSGSNITPILEGKLNLVQGHIQVGDKLIDFEKGHLIFDKHPKFYPLLDTLGRNETGTLGIKASVVGRADDPVLVITSKPALPYRELIKEFMLGSNHFFGRDNNPLSTEGEPQVLNVPVPDLPLIDTFVVEKIDTNGPAKSGVVFRIGRDLNKKNQLSIEKGVGVKDARLLFESYLASKLNLEIDAYAGKDSTPDPKRQTDGGAGIGLVYRHDY